MYFAITLAVYFLSIGPVFMLLDRGIIKRSAVDVLEVIYAPVIWLNDKTPLKKPLTFYVELWGDMSRGSK